jgi:hypothetical protein
MLNDTLITTVRWGTGSVHILPLLALRFLWKKKAEFVFSVTMMMMKGKSEAEEMMVNK